MHLSQKRTNAKVFVRILPSVDMCHENIKIETNHTVIYVRRLQDFNKGLSAEQKGPNFWRFETDGIFYNASQEEVYSIVMKDVLDTVLMGSNAVVLAYGQTGSGKSFTVNGLRNQFHHRGLVPRFLSQLFDKKEKMKNVAHISFGMSMVEISEFNIKDLLVEKRKVTSSQHRDPFSLVKNVPIESETSGLKLIFDGEGRRSVATAAPYEGSHLGHCILTLHIQYKSLVKTAAVTNCSKLHLVDMAGVTSLKKPSAAWKSRHDVGSANIDKLLLEHYIINLVENQEMIPQLDKHVFLTNRLSTLIRYLSDSLTITSVMRFIGHIRGSFADLDITLSTLRFGGRIRAIKPNYLNLCTKPEKDLEVDNLREKVNQLQEELELTYILANQPNPANISQARFEQLKRLVEKFLLGEVTELMLLAAGQATLTLQIGFQLFKDKYAKLLDEKEHHFQRAASLAAANDGAAQIKVVNKVVSPHTTPAPTKARGKKLTKKEELSSQKERLPSPSELHPIGETDNSGISIGPGKTSNYMGVITRAIKKHRTITSLFSKNSSNEKDGIKEGSGSGEDSVTEEKDEPVKDDPSSQLPALTSVPSRDQAWQYFMSMPSMEVKELQVAIEELQGKVQLAQRSYSSAATRLGNVRTSLELAQVELTSAQQQRHVRCDEIYDSQGRITIGETEKKFLENVLKKKNEISYLVDKVGATKTDLKFLSHKLNEAKKKLEEKFQHFCRTTYGVPSPVLEVQQLEVDHPASKKLSADRCIKDYQEFQRAMLSRERSKPKPHWIL
uniref:(California timema) hypothetical protein n=1 Tax=Timema californicum TaxID=61474 RepID=A0A7R9IX06_TIMCA|nr:unnamed protein product [Timema californicum]